MAIRVWARVDAAEAVRAGSAVSGILRIDLTDADLARLTQEQREELSRLPGLGSSEQPGGYDSPATIPGGRLDVESVIGWLSIRIERHRVALARKDDLLIQMRVACERYLRGEIDAETFRRERPGTQTILSAHDASGGRQVQIDYRDYDLVPGCLEAHDKLNREERAASERAQEQRRLQEREREEREAREKAAAEETRRAHVAAVVEIVRQRGTDSQRARMTDGLLPEQEAEALVRDHLLAGLADAPRYERMDGSEIEHAESCYSEGPAVEFSADDATELPEGPYERLRELRKLAGEAVTVSPREHRAHCGECEAEAVRYSARAAITWHGKEYAREYALDQ